ncbi:MAG: GTPase Era [Bacteroidetes bacterium 4572_77]|nr:MAG: GTPase Era [Bacteroidetes bacterium 4572_77]
MTTEKKHKSGFVNIIGNPNVGKSTLMNALVGEKLSIITSKAQTTRHRIMGIVSGEDFQIVYSDTPGIIKPNYKLQEGMMGFVNTAMVDADIFLYLVERKASLKDDHISEILKKTTTPVIVVVNKIDLSDQTEVMQTLIYWQNEYPNAEIIPISALEKFNIERVLQVIKEKLPESPPYYDKGEMTDKTERFFVSEIIREKILLNYQKEIPYSTEVVVEAFKEEEHIIRIQTNIFVARQSQKGILIGHEGKMLKKVGTQARIDMEAFFEKKIFLELFVKVKKDWRDDEQELRRFGYVQ